MAKKVKKIEDEELLEGYEGAKKLPVPKHAVNFTDKQIKEMEIEESIKGLLKAKREADEAKDKAASRKIRRALRAAGCYVSKMREENEL
jgi:hypothetical protein